jgi:hypothetical protein
LPWSGQRPAGEDRKLACVERGAGPAALELPARRLEDAPRLDQRQIVQCDVELLGDREAKRPEQLVRRIAAEPRRIDLGDQSDALFASDLQLRRERGHAAGSDRRMSALGAELQVLGVEVPAANDDHVLRTPYDKQLGDVKEVCARQDQLGAGVLDDGAQPRERAVDSTRVRRIGRNRDDAGVQTPEEGRDEVDAALVQEEGPIPGHEALLERSRHALRTGAQGSERQLRRGPVRLPVVEKPQRQAVGPFCRVSVESGADVIMG